MSDIYDGKLDRRDQSSLYRELGELHVRVAHIEESIAKLDKVSEQLDAFMKQGKGIAKMFQILFYVIGPLVAVGYWIKEHVR